jgi:predicted Zn-dependent peptidase
MNFTKKTFENGLRLITVPIESSSTTTIMVVAETGAKYELKTQNGISHFLEHMCFKGTEKRPTAMDIARDLDGIGSRSNAFTMHEYTGYWAKAHPKHTEKIVDVLTDIYLNSTFPVSEIEKEKGVILEEMNMYEDTPQALAPYLFLELLYGSDPAGSNILGDRDVIKKIVRDDFIGYRSKHYVAKATIVIVSGAFNQSIVEELVEKSFARISTAPRPKNPKLTEKQSKPKIKVKYKKTDQTHLVLGVRTWGAGDERNIALSVLETILGGGMSSRLFAKLREEMGVGYYVHCDTDTYANHGSLYVSAGVDKSRVKEVVSAIIEEFKKLLREEVKDAELQKTKDYIIGTMHLNLESSDGLGGFYALQEVTKGKLETPSEIEHKIKKVTAKDIKNVAKDIFHNNRLNLALVGDVENEKELRAILKI